MRRKLMILTFCALAILLIVCGCTQQDLAADTTTTPGVTEEASPSAEPVTEPAIEPIPEPVTTEPVTTEPVTTEPVTTEPVTTEPVTTEPVTTEPVTTEPVTTEPVTTEPTTPEPETTPPEPETTPSEPETTPSEPETTVCAHEKDEWRIVQSPTCTQIGLKQLFCQACGEFLREEEVLATGHTEVQDTAILPTCTEAGKTAGSHCTVCGSVLTDARPIPALGHVKVTVPAKEPTCTENGRTEGSHCSACGEILKISTVIPFWGHTQVTIPAVPPTCIQSGTSEGTFCSTCGIFLVECHVISAPGHVEATLPGYPPTEDKAGITDGVICSVCHKILVRQNRIPPTGESSETETLPESDTEIESETTPEPDTETTSETTSETTPEPDTEPATDTETETAAPQEPPHEPNPDADRWDGSIASGFAGGKGTESEPYRITSAAQLAFLARQINSNSTTAYAGKYFRLEADLDLDGREWTPIGCLDTTAFGGHFDGNGHTVSNFCTTVEGTTYSGLFGCIHGGTLQNLHVTGVTVHITASASVFAGGLVGYTDGNIHSCSAQGSVTVYTTEESVYSFAGGLVGYQAGGEISNCSARVYVSATATGNAANASAGGLAAYLAGSNVNNSYAHGNVYAKVSSSSSTAFAGGLVGEASKNSIIHSYATGTVQAQSIFSVYVGGLIGTHSSGQNITGCWASGDVTALCDNTDRCYVGGLAGRTKAKITNSYRYEGQSVSDQSADNPLTQTGEPCSLEQLNTASFYTDTLGWSGTVWDVSRLNFVDDTYPIHRHSIKN